MNPCDFCGTRGQSDQGLIFFTLLAQQTRFCLQGGDTRGAKRETELHEEHANVLVHAMC